MKTSDNKTRVVMDLDVDAVCALYGVPLENGVACCPFHEEKSPSFGSYVGEDGKRRLKCRGRCGWSGDVIDFVMARAGIGYAAALAECVKLLDAGLEATPYEPGPPPDFSGTVSQAQEAARADHGVISRFLHDRHSKIPASWLVSEFRLGTREDEIVIPHYAVGADLPHAVKRRLDTGEKRAIGGSRFTHLYGVWRNKGEHDVVLVEGESDTWTVAYLLRDERTLVVGLPRGVGSGVDPLWLDFLTDKTVTIMFDGDASGRAGMQRWSEALHTRARAVWVAHVPEGTDASSCPPGAVEKALRKRSLYEPVDGLIFEAHGKYWRTARKADDPARPITNWSVKILRRVQVMDARTVWEVELPDGTRTIIRDTHLADTRTLIRWANPRALAVFTVGADTQYMVRLFEQESLFVPRAEGTEIAGWDADENAWVFPEPAGPLGTSSKTYVAGITSPDWSSKVINLVHGDPDRSVAAALVGLNHPEVMTPLLGWVAAAPLRAICPQFPTMAVLGSAGSGKTTLVGTVLEAFGFSDGSPVSISNTTPHAVWALTSSTNAIPVWFDEYRPGARADGLAALDQAIRDGWNGAPTYRGGVKENASALSTLICTAPMIVSGESAFQEQSHAERMLIVNLRRADRNANALAALRGMDRVGFGRKYLAWLLHARQHSIIGAPPIVDDRPQQALAVVRWGYDLFCAFVSDFMGYDLPAYDDTRVKNSQTQLLDDPPILRALRSLYGTIDRADGGLVVWAEGDDLCVRTTRLPVAVKQHTDIVLPGNSKAVQAWLIEKFPGSREDTGVCSRYLRIPGGVHLILSV